MKSKTLSLKTIIKKLEFLQKADLINETFEEIEILLLANKLIEKIPDTDNVKEHYQSFIRKKNRKSVKKIRNNYLSTKNFWHCWYEISYYRISRNFT